MISIQENKQFTHLMSGDWLNGKTTRAFMVEAFKETVGPGSIAMAHYNFGRATWKPLAASTVRRKGHRTPFYQTGRTLRAISAGVSDGKLLAWGSSADIYAGQSYGKYRYSANGVYGYASATKTAGTLVAGFNGRYKHSAGFNRVRRELASEKLGRKVKSREARRIVSVGQVERRLRTINADRAGRGLKRIRKTAAMGAQGIDATSKKMVLARGKDNLAYADIVQRGKFMGIQGRAFKPTAGGMWTKSTKSMLFSPKGLSAQMRSGGYVKGTAVHGVARPLFPYRDADKPRLHRAMNRAMENLANEMNKA